MLQGKVLFHIFKISQVDKRHIKPNLVESALHKLTIDNPLILDSQREVKIQTLKSLSGFGDYFCKNLNWELSLEVT